jgi:hypothetical protein
MFHLSFTFAKALANQARLIEQARLQAAPQLRTRMVMRRQPDGTTAKVKEHYHVRPGIISDGAEKTLWILTKWQLKAVERYRATPALFDGLLVDELPPVATNNEELARVRGRRVADRTIRNHIQELLDAGFILKKQFRGTNADFYLWINPDLVWEPAQQPKNAQTEATHIAAYLAAQGTNFPLIKAPELQATSEIETGPVENDAICREAGHSFSGYTGQQAEGEPGHAGATDGPERGLEPKIGLGAGAAAAPATGQKTRLAERQRDMVQQAWVYALKLLPWGRRFTAEEHRKAEDALFAGVYCGFEAAHMTARSWETYHEQVLERLEMVAAYYRKNPKQYPGTPWAEVTDGKGYFDYGNRIGFHRTLDWHARALAYRLNRRIVEALRLAHRQHRQLAQGKLPKALQHLNAWQLYRHHEAKLGKLGPDALRRYYLQFTTPATAGA